MGILAAFHDAIAKVGAPVRLLRQGREIGRFTASLQSRDSGGETAGRAGLYLSRRLVLYTACGGDGDLMQPGDTVAMGALCYYVQGAEQVFFGGKPIYHKARLVPEEGSDE